MTELEDYMDLKTPRVTDQNRPFWEALGESRLTTTYCPSCQAITGFPPRVRCPRCLAASLDWRELNARGRLYSYTRVWVSGGQFADEIPYYLCLIDLTDGIRIAGRLKAGDDQPTIGSDVELRFDDPALPFYVVLAEAGEDDPRRAPD
jgi:uncharacterized OB-fold protein